jgi:hypothetical protein
LKALFLTLCLMLLGEEARADIFGADVAVLTQILTENIKQLVELGQILRAGRENLEILREVNRGINDSLALAQTISPYMDRGAFSDLKSVPEVLRKFGSIYGVAVNSPDAAAEQNVDTAIAEAVSMNNAIFDYTAMIDKVGEDIKSFSHAVSPGGAAKLTAESQGVILHVMNQQLRATGTLLKLQAEGLAAANKREKDHSAEYLESASAISAALKASNPTFLAPRF